MHRLQVSSCPFCYWRGYALSVRIAEIARKAHLLFCWAANEMVHEQEVHAATSSSADKKQAGSDEGSRRAIA